MGTRVTIASETPRYLAKPALDSICCPEVFYRRARTSKGCGEKISPRRRGESERSERQRGSALMEICEANLGSRPKAGALLGAFLTKKSYLSVEPPADGLISKSLLLTAPNFSVSLDSPENHVFMLKM